MKKVVWMIAVAASLALAANVSAQDKQQGQRPERPERPEMREHAPDQRFNIRGSEGAEERGAGWMEKMKAARAAFLTTELNLTEAEAQAFWPVYNQAQAEKDEAYKKVREAYRNMMAAVKEDKGDKEISNLLKVYLKESKVPAQIDEEYAPEYLKVLPASKVAKLYVSEEKFRKLQFQRHGQGGAPGQKGPGMRDGQKSPGMRDGQRGPRPGGNDAQKGISSRE